MRKLLKNILIFICLLTVAGALTYRLRALDNIGVALSLSGAVFFAAIIVYAERRHARTALARGIIRPRAPKNKNSNLSDIIALAVFVCSLAGCFFLLWSHASASAIISPWEVVPGYFFALYFLTSLALLVLLGSGGKKTCLLVIPFYLLSFSVAAVVYRLGFGFDPFIHRAAVSLIDRTGVIEPKTFYYLGQYALAVIAHKITLAPLDWIDRLLVPLLAGVFLPLAAVESIRKWFGDRRLAGRTALLLLVFTFPFLIVTTPQNLAYVFLLLAIVYSLSCGNIFDLILVYALAAAAMAAHPLAGIPAVLLAAMLTVYHSDRRRYGKKIFYAVILALAALSLPLVFAYVEKNQATGMAPSAVTAGRGDDPGMTEFAIPAREGLVLNAVYLLGFNLAAMISVLAIAGTALALKFRDKCRHLPVYGALSLALFSSYFLSRRLSFDFLISYERADYARRVLLMAVFFLLPFLILSVQGFVYRLARQNSFLKTSFYVFAAAMLTASLYLSYPRLDNYHNSRGFSVSLSDVAAVRLIDERAEGDYIVLANQQVGAAALREFGFKKYYQPQASNQKSQIFYYSIPTGGPLYRYYLEMVYEKPARATMEKAMDLAGVSEAYFVLNKYWWASPKIAEEAKLEADGWDEIDNGEVYVFKYKTDGKSED